MEKRSKPSFSPFSLNNGFGCVFLYTLLFCIGFLNDANGQIVTAEKIMPPSQVIPDSIPTVLQSTQLFSFFEKDFGAILSGDTAFVTFTFTNYAESPVYIKTVLPGCECTIADFTKGPIPKFEVGEINLQYISRPGEKGRVDKKAIVKLTTDPEIIVVTFTGMVVPKL